MINVKSWQLCREGKKRKSMLTYLATSCQFSSKLNTQEQHTSHLAVDHLYHTVALSCDGHSRQCQHQLLQDHGTSLNLPCSWHCAQSKCYAAQWHQLRDLIWSRLTYLLSIILVLFNKYLIWCLFNKVRPAFTQARVNLIAWHIFAMQMEVCIQHNKLCIQPAM